MLLILFFLIPLLKGEKHNLEIIQNEPNYFDGEYQIFSKTSGCCQLFGYSPEKTCILKPDENGFLIYIQDVRTFELSGPAPIIVGHGNLKPEACFTHNDYSYLIFKNEKNNETSIIRGQNKKIFKNLDFEYFKFDHVYKASGRN